MSVGRAKAFLQQEIDVYAFYRSMGVFAVLLVALALSWGATQGSVVLEPSRADAGQYILSAWNLKSYGVYSRSQDGLRDGTVPEPDAVRTPGYPLFLMPFLGEELNADFIPPVQTVQSLLVGGSVLLTFLLFRLFMPYAFALGAAGLTAISPHLANSAIYLLTESLFAFMVVLSLYLLAWLIRRPRLMLATACGLAMGYGALVRPSLQFLPFFIIPVLWMYLPRPNRLRLLGMLAAAYLAVYGAWGARNLYSLDQWSDPTPAAATVQHGMYPDMMYGNEPESLGVAYNYDPANDRIAGDMKAVLAELWDRASDSPGEYLRWYLVGKPLVFWQWNIVAGMGDVFIYPTIISPYRLLWPFKTSHWIAFWLHWPAVFLAALGCILAFVSKSGQGDGRSAGMAQLVSVTLIYFTLLHMVGAPYPRYSIPLRPELFGMAVFAGWVVWSQLLSELPVVHYLRRRYRENEIAT